MARLTYKYRIYPTAKQREKMEGWLEKLRWLYNTALAERRNNWRYRGRSVRGHEQRMNLPALKKRAPQFEEVHSQVLQNTLIRLDRAFENFFRRVREGRENRAIRGSRAQDATEVSPIRRLPLSAFSVTTRYVFRALVT